MNISDILSERVCPSCGEVNARMIFELTKDQFLYNNPTHNLEWFESLSIPDDFAFPFLKCNICDFMYTRYRLRDDYNFRFYNEGILVDKSLAKVFRKEKRVKQTEIWLNLLRNGADKSNLKVLDYGGGWGDFLAISKAPGIDVVGLEFDQRKIDYAQALGIPMGDFDLIESKAPYDLFMCNQVMEHLDKPKEALSHLRSLLIPGAIGFVGVPDFNDGYLDGIVALINSGGIPPKEVNPFGHLNYFSPETFKRMLVQTGFEIFLLDPARQKVTVVQKLIGQSSRKSVATPRGNLFYVRAV